MTTPIMSDKKVHEGRNVKRIRELLGVKQEALAAELGMSQQTISNIEQRDMIDAPILENIAKTLGVPIEAIKNFSDEATINFIANTFNDSQAGYNYQCTFNPIEKWLEAMTENKKLYESLLKEKDEKIALMEKLLAKKK